MDKIESAPAVDNEHLEIPKDPGSGEKAIVESATFGVTLSQKNSQSRLSAVTSDLYSYTGYKVWKARIRNSF